jgi:ATP-dependent helicase HrpB
MDTLPIEAALPALIAALRSHGRAVLEAPPGAGKTTRVPLALLEAGLLNGRLILLEPRRLATRAAATRMAETLGEKPGQTVGYRMRGESAVSAATRIEVVTEGILTRMIQTDPALEGVAAVIFDEFHERSLHADLGLALTWQIRQTLRPDLLLLVMSATLDAAPVATYLDEAPRITSEGRAFPVEVVHLPRPLDRSLRFEGAMAGLIRQAFSESEGHVLAFLPGEGEIRRTMALIADLNPVPLYGALPFKQQQEVLAPSDRRKVVLATSIAETSLTIDGVRVVVDGGLARRAVFDPATGMARLVTGRVTKAEAVQRQGRAGRQAPGRAYKLWAKAEEGALAAYPAPEIEAGDLSALALELATWGDESLTFLTAPDAARLTEARLLLADLGATEAGRITEHGRAMAGLPLHPRLAHMVLTAGKAAAPLAALLSERDPMREAGADLMARLDGVKRMVTPELRKIADEARRIERLAPERAPMSPGMMAALAFPDRIAQRRGDSDRFLLSGGKGARMDGPGFPKARYLAVTETDGDPREAKIRTALALAESEVLALKVTRADLCAWSPLERRIRAVRQDKIGALVVSERPLDRPDPEAVNAALCDGLRQIGLPHREATLGLQARAAFLRRDDASVPDLSDDALLRDLEHWLAPFLTRERTAADLARLDILPALQGRLGAFRSEVDRLAPAHFRTPLGRDIAVDYAGEHPSITLRLQEMFGVSTHPVVGRAARPLRVTLLSPGGKPIQVTMDVPGFWRSSYPDVRKDMRGRYPRHPWPEDPWNADPTLRAKPRGQ